MSLRSVCNLAFLATLLAGLLFVRVSLGAPTPVLLGRPAVTDAHTDEVLNRVYGELVADGFRVMLGASVTEADRVKSLIRLGQEQDAVVAAGVFLAADASQTDLVVVDRVTGRFLMRTAEAAGPVEDQPALLGRRTVEILRASLLDFLAESLRRAATKTLPLSDVPSIHAPLRAAPRWELQGGLGLISGFGGVGAALLPVARVGFRAAEAVNVRVTGAWLGTQPTVDSANGSATVDQAIAVVECVVQPWPRWRIRPAVSVGTGTYYVGVNGTGVPPYVASHSRAFTWALLAGVGAALALAPHVDLVAEEQMLLSNPGISVRFAGVDEARLGRPNLLTTMSLAGHL